jgi:D-alanyl-D-alanine carboxypeptidase
MRSCRSLFPAVTIALMPVLPTVAAEGRAASPGASAKARSLLSTLQSRGVPAVQLAVGRGDALAVEDSYGPSRTAHSGAGGGVFAIASITKTFTSALVLKLVDKGKLRLDSPIRDYVPGVSPVDCRTVAHLLTHTSGIPDYLQTPEYKMQSNVLPATPAELVQLILLRCGTPSFPEGTRFEYSNSNYVLLGWICEKAAGRAYGDQIDDLCQTAGLKSTRFGLPSPRTLLVPGHAPGPVGAIPLPGPPPLTWAYAAGGITSTAADLCLWGRAFVVGKVARRDLTDKALTPARLLNGSVPSCWQEGSYGLGWRLSTFRGKPLRFHDGLIDGFSSILAVWGDSAELQVAILCDAQPVRDLLGSAKDLLDSAINDLDEE